ncbi:hypothetical protein [Lacticaseibacillus paracasei]|uniref:hypothetical protein n=1 Tax=Lacticaseibacillus paracasei TaxID=1597 RepID=UPI000F0B3C7A|nr:hypothetical protein [Lacticaseibacillus paracasei]RNE19145.1 hypothetical protein FAM3257_02214 [Lacticaseibacillus paracasei]TLQ35215.1 hypothetical protein FEZ40_11530 [Lacticaseibacillus paracasei]
MWDVTFINTQTGLPKTIYGVISIVAETGDKTEQFSPLTLVHEKARLRGYSFTVFTANDDPFSLGTNWIPESADGD